jgi:hypothetical protein
MPYIIKYCSISPSPPEDGSTGTETCVGDIEKYLII